MSAGHLRPSSLRRASVLFSDAEEEATQATTDNPKRHQAFAPKRSARHADDPATACQIGGRTGATNQTQYPVERIHRAMMWAIEHGKFTTSIAFRGGTL